MTKTVEWVSDFGSTTGSITDSWSEVREFESDSDSNKVSMLLPSIDDHHGDCWWCQSEGLGA